MRAALPIPSSMDLRSLMPRLRDLTLSTRDLSLAGLLVSPIWLALGIIGSDMVMIAAGTAAALASTIHLSPGLAARLRVASAVLRPLSQPR